MTENNILPVAPSRLDLYQNVKNQGVIFYQRKMSQRINSKRQITTNVFMRQTTVTQGVFNVL